MAHKCDSLVQCGEFATAIRSIVEKALALHTVTSQDSQGYCEMPATCGPSVWAILHGTVKAMRDHVCESCGSHGMKLISFLHDLVNKHLGKPLYDKGNFEAIKQAIMTVEVEHARQTLGNVEKVCQKGSENRPCKKSFRSLHQTIRKKELQSMMKNWPDMIKSWPLDVEVGAPICATAEGIALGKLSIGNYNSVAVPLICPEGDPAGTLHSHPGGSPEPSPQDLSEALRLHLQLLCTGVPQTGQVTCRRIW